MQSILCINSGTGFAQDPDGVAGLGCRRFGGFSMGLMAGFGNRWIRCESHWQQTAILEFESGENLNLESGQAECGFCTPEVVLGTPMKTAVFCLPIRFNRLGRHSTEPPIPSPIWRNRSALAQQVSFPEVAQGCLNASACNYDGNALIEDGSWFTSCLGCTDSNACNFDADATQDDENLSTRNKASTAKATAWPMWMRMGFVMNLKCRDAPIQQRSTFRKMPPMTTYAL